MDSEKNDALNLDFFFFSPVGLESGLVVVVVVVVFFFFFCVLWSVGRYEGEMDNLVVKMWSFVFSFTLSTLLFGNATAGGFEF